MPMNPMENKTVVKPKADKNALSQNDEFILNLVDLNAGMDLKKPNDRE